MQIFIKVLKIIEGIVLGLIFSFLTVVCLDALLPSRNPFDKNTLNLWFIGPIVAGWLFFMLWLFLRGPSKRNIKTNSTESLPDSASELINAIIESMRFRRSDRAEVRQELTDHFIDALSHCRDEQERKNKIAELVAEFGDVKLLGTLIRRGKKRCQPLWRKVLTHTPHAIGISILLLIVYIGWFFTGKPKPSIDYLAIWNEQIRPTVAESDNAETFYTKASEIYDANTLIAWRDKYEKHFDDSPRSLSKLSAKEKETLNKWLDSNTESLDLIRQGTQKPYYWQSYATDQEGSTELIAILLPHLSDFKNISELLCWQALVDAEHGNFQQAFDSCITTYTFGTHIRGQHKTLIEQLVSMAIQRITNDTIRIILDEHFDKMDTALLNNTKLRFAQLVEKQNFTIDYSGERLFMYDEAQRSFTQSRFGKSHLYLPRLSELGGDQDIYEQDDIIKNTFFILFTHPDKEETLQTIDRFCNTMETFVHQTPATRQTNEKTINQIIEEMIEENVLLNIMLPALGRCIELSFRNHINSQSTIVILSALQYHKTHNEYPESLQTLVESGHLKTIPIDPFSDKPLVYRKTEDSFVLYSVGSNFTDDGGASGTDDKGKPRRWGNHGDWIFWPVTDD